MEKKEIDKCVWRYLNELRALRVVAFCEKTCAPPLIEGPCLISGLFRERGSLLG